jgi:exosortase/archaeosortase family protein
MGRFMTEPLALANAWLIGGLLTFCGHPNEVLGSLVSAGDLQIQVVDACDGLRLLWAALLFAYAQLVSHQASFRTHAIVLGLTPMLTVVLNTVRVLMASLLFAKVPTSAAELVHDITGWTMMACSWFIPWLFISRLERSPRAVTPQQPTDSKGEFASGEAVPLVALSPLVIGGLLVLVLLDQFAISTPQEKRGIHSAEFAAELARAIPSRVGEFVGVEEPIPNRQLNVLRPDASFGMRYVGVNVSDEFLFIVSLHDDLDGHRGHQVERCYRNIGWCVTKQTIGHEVALDYELNTTSCQLVRQRQKHAEEMFVFKGSVRHTAHVDAYAVAMPLTQYQIVFSPRISACERAEIICSLTALVCGEYQEYLNSQQRTSQRIAG